ncbi:GIY-YIG catalytic domain-containing endonuclease [Acanthocystis turfacea Chlorella virus WI0606]|nr:GIY-YIG catalytic domain-containing endonuclease [Acanthocystis turfacea Chlorella virus WI0606]
MKCETGYIYKLTSPSDKVYIGQTIRPIEERFVPYKQGKGTNPYFTNALSKHGFDSFVVETFEVPVFMLNFVEITLIRNFNSRDRRFGYNSREGGSRGSISDEQKLAISVANRGKKKSDVSRKRMSISSTGKKATKETKKKLSILNSGKNNPMYGKKGAGHPKTGKKSTIETKATLSKLVSGDKNPMFGKTGSLNPNSKQVYVFGNLYNSCIEASNILRFLFPKVKSKNFINTWTRSGAHPEVFLVG